MLPYLADQQLFELHHDLLQGLVADNALRPGAQIRIFDAAVQNALAQEFHFLPQGILAVVP